MQVLPRTGTSSIKQDDYKHALLHLAWCRADARAFLLFGLAELIPSELPEADPTELQEVPLLDFDPPYQVCVERISVTAQEALAWYDHCREGNVAVPSRRDVTGGHETTELAINSFQQEPEWPQLVAVTELPFQTWRTVRAHHLLQATLPLEVSRLLTSAHALRWLSDSLLFDVVAYRELIGSVHLVAPDPVLRTVHHTLGVSADGETSDIHLIARHGQDIRSLTVHVSEHRPTGLVALHSVPVNDPYIRVEHIGRTDKIGLTIACRERGILEHHSPLGFIRAVSAEFSIVTGRKTVRVPDAPGRPGDIYEQPIEVGDAPTLIGRPPADDAAMHLHQARLKRERQQQAERLGQKWFYGDQAEARTFVRGLIARARKRVIIVDPYFAAVELFDFALATSRSEVAVEIVTSAKCLKFKDRRNPQKQAGEVLWAELTALEHRASIQVLVIQGRRPPVHDRFLVIDDDVWLSGISLNTIGECAGMMIMLPAPASVIENLEKIIRGPRVQTLEQWAIHHARGADEP